MRVTGHGGGALRATRLALIAVLVAIGLAIVTIVLGWGRPGAGASEAFAPTDVAVTAAQVFFVAVGAFIATRRPRNAVGWLMIVTALSHSLADATAEYAFRALVADPGSLPVGAVADWLAQWVRPPAFALGALLLLSFPDGRIPSPRWRPAAALAIAVGATAMVVGPLVTWPHRGRYVLVGHRTDVLGSLYVDGLVPAAAVTILIGVTALAVRFHRSRGAERQQVKWFVSATSFIAAAAVLTAVGAPEAATDLAAAVGVAALAIAIAVAILRYRLYEIDRIIRRTVVYAAVVVVLAGVYVGAVLGLQSMLRPVVGGSDLAVAGATLVAVAAFRPLRRRIQEVVERRFYRAGYDAQVAAEEFARRLRHELDLASIRRDLVSAAQVTLQPKAISLWLAADGTADGGDVRGGR